MLCMAAPDACIPFSSQVIYTGYTSKFLLSSSKSRPIAAHRWAMLYQVNLDMAKFDLYTVWATNCHLLSSIS